jgi:hypothetical protein
MNVPTIRSATEVDLERLVDVEVKAGQLFHTVGMSNVAEDVPERGELREAIERERVWVTEVGLAPGSWTRGVFDYAASGRVGANWFS